MPEQHGRQAEDAAAERLAFMAPAMFARGEAAFSFPPAPERPKDCAWQIAMDIHAPGKTEYTQTFTFSLCE